MINYFISPPRTTIITLAIALVNRDEEARTVFGRVTKPMLNNIGHGYCPAACLGF